MSVTRKNHRCVSRENEVGITFVTRIDTAISNATQSFARLSSKLRVTCTFSADDIAGCASFGGCKRHVVQPKKATGARDSCLHVTAAYT